MSKHEFSEFCALLHAQRKQLLDEVREKITVSGGRAHTAKL